MRYAAMHVQIVRSAIHIKHGNVEKKILCVTIICLVRDATAFLLRIVTFTLHGFSDTVLLNLNKRVRRFVELRDSHLRVTLAKRT